MKLFLVIATAVITLLSGSAYAAVSVSEQVLQTGQFIKPHCEPDPKTPDYDACTCDAQVHYPQLTGMSDVATQDRLNGWFKEQAAKAACEGDKAEAGNEAKSTKAHMSVSVHYEVTYSSPALLAFKFTDWAYTGGAHGDGSVIGVIVDLEQGKLLSPTDIFSTGNFKAVNQQIYETLTARPEGQVFRDQVEDRKGAFIKDGDCQGCTLILTPESVQVLFQSYEVAPYGAGDNTVPISAKYVGYKAVKDALAIQSGTKKK